MQITIATNDDHRLAVIQEAVGAHLYRRTENT